MDVSGSCFPASRWKRLTCRRSGTAWAAWGGSSAPGPGGRASGQTRAPGRRRRPEPPPGSSGSPAGQRGWRSGDYRPRGARRFDWFTVVSQLFVGCKQFRFPSNLFVFSAIHVWMSMRNTLYNSMNVWIRFTDLVQGQIQAFLKDFQSPILCKSFNELHNHADAYSNWLLHN